MKRRRAVSTAVAIALVVAVATGCSLLVKTSDLAGDADVVDGAAAVDARTTGDPDGGAPSDAGDAGASDPSLIGYWAFDETSGVDAEDNSGHGHGAVLTGATFAPDAGARGGAVSLSGGGLVSVASLTGSAFPKTGTLSIWFKFAPVSFPSDGTRKLFDAWDDTRRHLFMRYYASGSGYAMQIAYQELGAPSYSYPWVTETPLLANTWSHVVTTWSAETKSAALYLNGAVVQTSAYQSGAQSFVPDGQRFALGDTLVGFIDEVRLYDRAMPATEATTLP